MIIADNVKLPVITMEDALRVKEIDYRVLLYLVELSNFNIEDDADYRFLYLNKLNKHIKEIAEEIGVSEKTIQRKINILKKHELIESTMIEDEIIYLIRVKEYEKNFVVLSSDERYKLQKLKSNTIKLYLVIKYTLEYRESNKIQLIHLADSIGASIKNVSPIARMVEELEAIGLINYKIKFEKKVKVNKNGLLNPICSKDYFFYIPKHQKCKQESQEMLSEIIDYVDLL